MTKKKVVIIHWGSSAYDSLSALLTLAGREIKDAYEVVDIAFETEGWEQTLKQTINGGQCAFALAMSGVGLHIQLPDSTMLWDAAKIPFFTWYCDHPAYFPARHATKSRYAIHGYVFPDHARYNRDHLNPNGAAYSVHYGIPSRANFCGEPLPLAERNGRILFAKSGGDPRAIRKRWRETLTRSLVAILDAATEALAGQPTAAFAGTIQAIADEFGLHLAPNGEMLLLLLREADNYLRAQRSTLLAEAIKPYPVDVVGRNWDHVDWSGATARLGEPIPFAELAKRLPTYLGTLSLNPLIEHSAHDRVFCALATRTVPVSDTNPFIKANFPTLDAYGFRLNPDSVREAIEALLANPQRGLDATEAAFVVSLPRLSLRRSMAQIEEFCALHPLNSL